jgi:hemoglobin
MHCGKGDLTDLNRRFVACFVQAIDDAGLPDEADFRTAMREYLEWAVGEVSGRSDGDAPVPVDAPPPRWSWDGVQPPYR